MPYINVKTNSKLVSTCADELKSELGRAITAIPGKSEAWLMINIDELIQGEINQTVSSGSCHGVLTY